jgi:hypothetical protein
MGKESCVFANRFVISAEFMVLSEYLNSSGFADYGLNREDLILLAKELFHTWLTFRATVTTLKNTSSEQDNICYFVDDSFVIVNEDSIFEYVKSCPNLLDYKLAARFALHTFN